ncbi:hypothetical protein ABZS86_35305 [Streptomyces sp. NPDC005355]|uniref:hypothetical protein n=1 Tax=Streptomyces sp. NPDC005355 TaxID=3157038 RepID=UPI0033AA3D88
MRQIKHFSGDAWGGSTTKSVAAMLPFARVYEIADTWPAFIQHEPVAGALLSRVAEDFPHYCVVATDGARVVARGLSVPFNAEIDDREEMPDQGWDRVLVWRFATGIAGTHRRQPMRLRSRWTPGTSAAAFPTACWPRCGTPPAPDSPSPRPPGPPS